MAAEPLSPDGYLAPTRDASRVVQMYKAQLDSQWSMQVDEERRKESNMLTTGDLISFGYQCIHRDIAARNILVTGQRAIRIADFGLARKDTTIYHIRNSQSVPLPLKWMALESIIHSDFTEQA
ncbi:unnamed protein product [Gongylonema pulchrum]|uniref:Protein kinase domain-containing protein n=1 Tax=Gongylonema pulchrum TaxID=637853 RepID=A0A183EM83_9BILA|nr:unnamed protein product [Gongylonema pulchrum]